jgi:hypothetical protein
LGRDDLRGRTLSAQSETSERVVEMLVAVRKRGLRVAPVQLKAEGDPPDPKEARVLPVRGAVAQTAVAAGGRWLLLCGAFVLVRNPIGPIEPRRGRSGPCGGDLVAVQLGEVVGHHQ